MPDEKPRYSKAAIEWARQAHQQGQITRQQAESFGVRFPKKAGEKNEKKKREIITFDEAYTAFAGLDGRYLGEKRWENAGWNNEAEQRALDLIEGKRIDRSGRGVPRPIWVALPVMSLLHPDDPKSNLFDVTGEIKFKLLFEPEMIVDPPYEPQHIDWTGVIKGWEKVELPWEYRRLKKFKIATVEMAALLEIMLCLDHPSLFLYDRWLHPTLAGNNPNFRAIREEFREVFKDVDVTCQNPHKRLNPKGRGNGTGLVEDMRLMLKHGDTILDQLRELIRNGGDWTHPLGYDAETNNNAASAILDTSLPVIWENIRQLRLDLRKLDRETE